MLVIRSRPASGQLLGSLADEAARLAERSLREYGDSATTPSKEASDAASSPARGSPQPTKPIPQQPLKNTTAPLHKPPNGASTPASRETNTSASSEPSVPAAEATQNPKPAPRYPTARQFGIVDQPEGPKADGVTCPTPNPVKQFDITDPKAPKSFVFNSMSAEEVLQTSAYVTAKLGYFEATEAQPLPEPNQDFVAEIELLDPPKTATLAWLDGSAEKPPQRFARVSTIRGSQYDCMDYKVGPLDSLATATNSSDVIMPLTKPGQIPWVKRPRSNAGFIWLDRAFNEVFLELETIITDFSGRKCLNGERAAAPGEKADPCSGFPGYGILAYPVLSGNDSQRLSHVKIYSIAMGGDEQNMFVLPITAQIDESSTDLAEWKPTNFVYCSQGPFASASDLAAAYKANNLTKCDTPNWGKPAYNFTWATTFPFQPPQSASDLTLSNPNTDGGLTVADLGTVKPESQPKAGVRTYMPQGSRVTVQPSNTSTGAAFQWLEWSGHVTLRPVSGISLWDLKFRGERIVYELSLQELYIAYNSYSGAGTTYFLDSYFGIGLDTLPLRMGYDCPNHAIFLDAEVVADVSTTPITPNAICIFEDDVSQTAWRHTNPGGPDGAHLDGGRAVELVVRTIATLGNYDYQCDVRFHTDGSVSAGIQAGGFMQTLFWEYPYTAGDLPFGTVVGKNLFAPLHDHLAGWKVDIDVLGTNNTFASEAIKVGTYEEALSAQPGGSISRPGESLDAAGIALKRPGWFGDAPDVIKYVETTVPGVEGGYSLNLDTPAVWQFLASDNSTGNSTNAWGQRRGYAVVPTAWQTKQLLPPTHPLTKAASWTKYHLAVTKQRDNETRSSASRYDNYLPGSPVVLLDTFIDGDSTVDQDLVGWVMVGVQHVPRSEDIPVVSNFGSSFAIKPWNYWNQLPSRVVYDDPDFKQCAASTQGITAEWPPPNTSF